MQERQPRPDDNDQDTQTLQQLRARARPLGAKRLTEIVAHVFGLPPAEIRAHSRPKVACQARQALYLVLSEICGWDDGYIGTVLGRDRATITHGVKRARVYRQTPEGQAAWHFIETLILQQQDAGR